MKNICDYTIIQRDSDGFGRAEYRGTYRPQKGCVPIVRVMREDDNMTVVPWQECEMQGDEWSTDLVIPEGGLYRIEVRRAEIENHYKNNTRDWAPLIACAHHVGVGDIFLLAGQSNMSGYGKDPAYDPPELGVHLYDNSGNWVLAAHPLFSVPDPIYDNNDCSSGTSPGLAFGRMMSKRLNIPVGLVSAALGGSSLESWNPAELEPFLYGAMSAKVREIGKFAGMVWYQGCNETTEREEAETYLEKFKETVTLWREKFGHFPIATCQINRHAWKEEDRERNWGLVREAQRQAGIQIEDVYVVPTMDLPTCDGIHNTSASCITVGERLAGAMLKGHYGMNGVFAPSIKSIKKLDSRNILLTFYESHTLRTMDDIASGMNIEDENGMMKCEKVVACGEQLKITAERDIGKNAVFHAYWNREVPAFFVRDVYGLPMLACYGVKIED